MPLWASLMPHLLRILFYETFQMKCLYALTIMAYFDKREEFFCGRTSSVKPKEAAEKKLHLKQVLVKK